MNRLSYALHRGATGNKDRSLLVDGRPLVDLLESAVPPESPQRGWPEKQQAVVVPKELKKTMSRPGEFHLFTCSGCGIPEDLMLDPVVVAHEGDEVVWRIKPPGAEQLYDEFEMLEYRFERQAYEQAVQGFLQRDPTSTA